MTLSIKATLVGLSCAGVALVMIVVLFILPMLDAWSRAPGVGAVSYNFLGLLFLLVPAVPVAVILVWLQRRAQQGQAMLSWRLPSALAVGVLLVMGVWNVYAGMSAVGSAGIGAVSVGVSELVVEALPVLAFIVGFTWTVRRGARATKKGAPRV